MLTEGPIAKGTCFWITFQTATGISEYEREVVELRENELIKTRNPKGRLYLTLSVKPVSGGTILIYDEEFVNPVDVLFDEHDTGFDWRSIFSHILHLDRVRFIDHEREEKINCIKMI